MTDLRRPAIFVSALSLLLALVLAFDAIPFLRGGFGWQWPYRPVGAARAIPLLVGLAIYLSGGWFILRLSRRALPVVVWAFLGTVVIPLFVLALRSDDVANELFARTVSGVTTGPHQTAAELDWENGEWRDWPAVMDSYEGRSVHVRLSPPGLPMFYGLLNNTLNAAAGISEPLFRALLPYQCHNWNLLAYSPSEWASAWFGMLMPLWSAFAVFPLHAISRRLVGVPREVILWWPLVPAVSMFVPTWNTLYPLLSLLAFSLLLNGLERERGAVNLAAAGLLTGLLAFANFSMVPLIALFGVYTLLYFRQSSAPLSAWSRSIRASLWLGLGTALPWLAYGVVTGLTPFDLLSVAMNAHLALDRPYLPWLWLHFWEWALFTGIPLVILWLLAIWRHLRNPHMNRQILPAALALSLGLVLLSGTARGETGRVWLFFAPFVLVAAADAISPQTDSASGPMSNTWLAIAIGQATIFLAVAITWAVIDAPDIHPRPDSPGALATIQPANATFDGQFRLASWDAAADGREITLRLDWQGITPVTTPYWFSALLVSPDGAPVSESVVWQPLETRYPTTCWTPGEWIGDTITLPLPNEAASGEWWVSLAAFADTEHPENRLAVMLPDGTQDTQVGLGPISVP